MIGLGILWLVLFVVFVVLAFKDWNGSDVGVLYGILAFIFGIGCILGTVIPNANYVGYNEDIQYQGRCIVLHQKMIDDLLPQINKELDRYPIYEQGMFKGYLTKTGAIVNIPPSLQASDTMIKKADEIKAANTELYKDRFDRSYDLLLVRQNYRIGLWFTIYMPKP
jgi:hypothetical protein